MSKIISELDSANIKKKAVKGAGVNVFTNALDFIFHTVGFIILARLLSPKDFGLVAMVTAFSLLPMNFGLNGFAAFIIQKQSLSKEEINSIFWVHVFVALFLSICFVLFGFFLVKFYSEKALCRISTAMALTIILVALYTTHSALIRREMKYGPIAVGDLSASMLSMVCAICAAVLGMSYWAIVIRQLVRPALQVVVSWFLCPWRPGKPRNLASAIPCIKYGLKVYGNFTIDFFSKNIDKVLLGRIYGSSVLGNYDRAGNLSAIPAGQILMPLSSVALATLSRLREDTQRFIQYYTKAVALITFIGTLAATLLMLSAQDLIPLLLGPKWSETCFLVMAFSPGITALLVEGSISWLHLSLGTPGRWFRWNIFATTITIIIFAVAAPYGALVMATAFSIAKFLIILPGIWYAGRPVQLKIRHLLSALWPYFASGLITSILWLYIPQLWPSLGYIILNLSRLNHLLLVLFITPLIYITIVTIFQRNFSSCLELIHLFRLSVSR